VLSLSVIHYVAKGLVLSAYVTRVRIMTRFILNTSIVVTLIKSKGYVNKVYEL
jgi:hypothetical protein